MSRTPRDVENSDVQIVHDIPFADGFGFLEYTTLPRTIFIYQNLSKIRNLVFDILSSRPSPNRVGIWVAQEMFETVETSETRKQQFSDWLLMTTSEYYGFRHKDWRSIMVRGEYWSFLDSTKNIYPIMTTNKALDRALDSLNFDDSTTENFMVLLLPRNNGVFELCVKVSGLFIKSSQNFNCVRKYDDKILKGYFGLTPLPIIWYGNYISFDQTENNRGISNKNLPNPSINPLSRDFSISIPLYMAVVIVRRTNASLEVENTAGRYPKVFIESANVVTISNGQLNEYTYTSGLLFLSCYAESYITFDFYITPFQPTLWLAFITSMLLTFIVLYFYMTWNHNLSPYPVYLSFISVLFDDFSSVPEAIGHSLFYRLVFVTWGPAALIFTNCYSGLIISELNAPLRRTISHSFADIICQNRELLDSAVYPIDATKWGKLLKFENYKAYWGNVNLRFDILPTFKNPFASDKCYRILSPPIKTRMRHVGESESYFWPFILHHIFISNSIYNSLFQQNTISSHFLKQDLLLLLLMNPVHDVLPTGIDLARRNYTTTELQFLAERDIIDCREKNAFIASSHAVNAELDFLTRKYPSKKFHSGEPFQDARLYGWCFEGGGHAGTGISAVQRNLQALVQSGIYWRLKREMVSNMWVGRKPAETDVTVAVSPLTMDGAIITIFMLSGALLAPNHLVAFFFSVFHSCSNVGHK
ncbi:hypothetical protein Fcan01_22846 [Folsomia candida]|uniref:Uncharacterized protein n=1 Tax=Folsomia candida TaxID=158441 RepID=A0A226DBE6_FOLCA|nr:hypothetical protein Fcan01_22846 [Folsomia candida]